MTHSGREERHSVGASALSERRQFVADERRRVRDVVESDDEPVVLRQFDGHAV
jgi:hypothetical protein